MSTCLHRWRGVHLNQLVAAHHEPAPHTLTLRPLDLVTLREILCILLVHYWLAGGIEPPNTAPQHAPAKPQLQWVYSIAASPVPVISTIAFGYLTMVVTYAYICSNTCKFCAYVCGITLVTGFPSYQ